jgi:hypothetical protein
MIFCPFPGWLRPWPRSAMRRCNANAPGDVPYAAFNGHKAVFQDNVQSYSTVEPALDLTALTPLAFAWQSRVG